MGQLVLREELAARLESLRAQSKRIGFTSGVFDLLHPGHVDYLARAKALCDVLLVGVNSDHSVRQNKGPLRPVCTELDRARVVAALDCVDYAFIFQETNNRTNISVLKPDLYLKAGDYKKEQLSSASQVESYGGRVELVPFLKGYSSSALIEKIAAQFGGARASALAIEPYAPAPAVFLDRDGTINKHIEYLHEVSKFELIPGALEAMKKLKEAGYRLVIVTNQPGIGIGYFSKEEFFAVNREMLKAVSKAGFNIDKVYYCPHTRADNCSCRKPGIGMLKRAAQELNVVLEKSFMIGDMSSDVKAGLDAGCRSILLGTGQGGRDGLFEVTPSRFASDLLAAANWILEQA